KAVDAYGNLVSGLSVGIGITSGLTTLFGTTSTSTLATGLATYSDLSVQKVGTYTLKATAGALAATSSAVTIAAGAPSAVSFVQGPNDVAAGVSMTPAVTVKAVDQYGNLLSGKSVALNITGGAAALFGTATVSTSVSGIATYSTLSVHLPGSYT